MTSKQVSSMVIHLKMPCVLDSYLHNVAIINRHHACSTTSFPPSNVTTLMPIKVNCLETAHQVFLEDSHRLKYSKSLPRLKPSKCLP